MDKNIQKAVLGFVATDDLGRQDKLPTGRHLVSILEWKVLHSRIKWNGEAKDNLPEYEDPTPQLGIMLGNEEGVTWHRFNLAGFTRWNELTAKQQEDDKFEKVVAGEQVYACERNKSGQLVRISHDRRTHDAHTFINRFMSVMDCTGVSIGEALPALVETKAKLVIEIEDDEYQGKDQLKVTSFESETALVSSGDEFGE